MIWTIIIAAAVVIDQIFKCIVRSKMVLGVSVPVIKGFFNITYMTNSGAAWGMFRNLRWLFVVLTIIMVILLIYLIRKYTHPLLRTSLCLIVGGALGNLVDRLIFGAVTDFLDFTIFGYDYPVFNLADAFVVIGAILLAVYILFFIKEKSDE